MNKITHTDAPSSSLALALERAETQAVVVVEASATRFTHFRENLEEMFAKLATENELLRQQLESALRQEREMAAFHRDELTAAREGVEVVRKEIEGAQAEKEATQQRGEQQVAAALAARVDAVRSVKRSFDERASLLQGELAEVQRALEAARQEAASQGERELAETQSAVLAARQRADAEVQDLKREQEALTEQFSKVWRPASTPGGGCIIS